MAQDPVASDTLIEVLGLKYPPVALSPITEIPSGVSIFKGVSPSACAFWRHAEEHLFAVTSDDHMNCAVGAYVMGFSLTESAKGSLQEGLKMMCDVGYLAGMEEVAKIPTLSHQATAMLYGPLTQFPIAPEVVLLWVNPPASMLLSEAVGKAAWDNEHGLRILGRPGCAALAAAQKTGEVTLSSGCAGMRTFTGIESEYLLAAIPGNLLPSVTDRLRRMRGANCKMQAHYNHLKETVSFQSVGD